MKFPSASIKIPSIGKKFPTRTVPGKVLLRAVIRQSRKAEAPLLVIFPLIVKKGAIANPNIGYLTELRPFRPFR
jgi:hypothetical protein